MFFSRGCKTSMSLAPLSLKHAITFSRWLDSKRRVEDSREDCNGVSRGTEQKNFPDNSSLPRGMRGFKQCILEATTALLYWCFWWFWVRLHAWKALCNFSCLVLCAEASIILIEREQKRSNRNILQNRTKGKCWPRQTKNWSPDVKKVIWIQNSVYGLRSTVQTISMPQFIVPFPMLDIRYQRFS